MQITRFLSLNENQFLGCLSAFVDSLTGELNSAINYLRRLEGTRKGSAFAFEMQMDRHRYGVLIVLERWAELGRAFSGHSELGEKQPMLAEAAKRAEAAQGVVERANRVLDDAPFYTMEIVEAVAMALRTVDLTFSDEKEATAKAASLGPMLPEEYHEFRRVFQADLSER